MGRSLYIEIDNTINYLDLTITKHLQKRVIDLGIYHKPTSNITAIHNKSRHPFQLRYIEEMPVKNGFNLKTIHKLIRKQKSKHNNSAIESRRINKPNKWITLTYTGNESTRMARTLRKIDKNIKIA